MTDLELQKKRFVNHVAKFTDYGNIKIVDFKMPDSGKYRIRFLFKAKRLDNPDLLEVE